MTGPIQDQFTPLVWDEVHKCLFTTAGYEIHVATYPELYTEYSVCADSVGVGLVRLYKARDLATAKMAANEFAAADQIKAAPDLHRIATEQAVEIARLRAALKLALPILEAAVSFERAAEEYLTESQYELNAALGEPAATIVVSGYEALQAVRAALEVKP